MPELPEPVFDAAGETVGETVGGIGCFFALFYGLFWPFLFFFSAVATLTLMLKFADKLFDWIDTLTVVADVTRLL